MVIDNDIVELVTELEYQIGKECFNIKSTTQRGNLTIQGKHFRYPVHYYDPTLNAEWDTKSEIRNIDADSLSSIKYKFGANYLNIGQGIINVLSMLESRYGIDFNELEEKRKQG